MLPGVRYQLATKWEVLFANTFTQIDSESFSSSVIGIWEMSLWTSNMTPPPWIFLSFLYTLYGQVSGKSSEVATELSILVSWIATTCGSWKSRKASNSSFLPLMLLIFMLMNVNPLIKLLLFVPQGENLSFFSFVRGTNLFSVSKFTCSPKKESEKLKNSHFGQIHVQFVLFTISYWVSAMNGDSLRAAEDREWRKGIVATSSVVLRTFKNKGLRWDGLARAWRY